METTHLFLLIALAIAFVSAAPAEDLDDKVINGRKALTGEFPFIVSLQWTDNLGNLGRWCGGSIISCQWVVTAAHCIDASVNYTTFYVRAGVTNSWDTHNPNGQFVRVRHYIYHPRYRNLYNVNRDDIALLRLDTPLHFNQFVQPIRLPRPGYVPTGLSTIIGWGEAGNLTHHYNPDDLQAVNLNIYPIDDCKNVHYPTVNDQHVCPGYYGSGSCQGDSGGPLVQDINGQRTLIGASSFVGMPCGTSPSVYMNVASYLNDFINPNMARDPDQCK